MVATGVLVGGGVVMMICGGVGVDKVRKFSLSIGMRCLVVMILRMRS